MTTTTTTTEPPDRLTVLRVASEDELPAETFERDSNQLSGMRRRRRPERRMSKVNCLSCSVAISPGQLSQPAKELELTELEPEPELELKSSQVSEHNDNSIVTSNCCSCRRCCRFLLKPSLNRSLARSIRNALQWPTTTTTTTLRLTSQDIGLSASWMDSRFHASLSELNGRPLILILSMRNG